MKKYTPDDLLDVEFGFMLKFKDRIFYSQKFKDRIEMIMSVETLSNYKTKFSKKLCEKIKKKVREFLEYKKI